MKDYAALAAQTGIGKTPQLCQDALIEMLKELLGDKKFSGQESRKHLKFYKQDLPIPTEDDSDSDLDGAQAPYVIVQMTGGTIETDNDPQIVEFSIIICAYDNGLDRSAWLDVENIKEDIIQRVCSAPYFGGAFTILKPIAWAMQADDTHPYYYGAVNLQCTVPAMTQDTVLKEYL